MSVSTEVVFFRNFSLILLRIYSTPSVHRHYPYCYLLYLLI